MRKHLFTLAALTALAFCSFAGANAQTELVTNGGFETGNFAGWTNDGGGSFVSSGFYAHDGSFGAAYGAVFASPSLSQTLNTTIGATEHISFWQHTNGGIVNEMEFSFGGVVLEDDVNLAPRDWHLYTFDVIATSTTSVLQFNLRNDPSYDALDSVSVLESAASTTPEGSSLAMLGLGFVPLALGLRKKLCKA